MYMLVVTTYNNEVNLLTWPISEIKIERALVEMNSEI